MKFMAQKEAAKLRRQEGGGGSDSEEEGRLVGTHFSANFHCLLRDWERKRRMTVRILSLKTGKEKSYSLACNLDRPFRTKRTRRGVD